LPPVGNDIVDLRQTDNQGKSRDDRFVGRVFTTEERDRIAGASCPDKILWALWAAKEAAYKAVSRNAPSIRSTPRRYSVVFDGWNPCRGIDHAEHSAGRGGPDGRGKGEKTDAPAISEGQLTGRVLTPGGEVALRTIVTDDYVHALTVSREEDFAALIHRVDLLDAEKDTGGASAFVRRQLLSEIARRLECPLDDLEIRKERSGPGAPGVFLQGRPLAAEVSLSHDGRFTAFAFRIPC